MTVAELIEKLKWLPQELPVCGVDYQSGDVCHVTTVNVRKGHVVDDATRTNPRIDYVYLDIDE